MNYGLNIEEIKIEDDHYVLGAQSLQGEILQPDGQWDNFLPAEERQANDKFDTYSCTSFGTLNALEMLERRVYNN